VLETKRDEPPAATGSPSIYNSTSESDKVYHMGNLETMVRILAPIFVFVVAPFFACWLDSLVRCL